MSLPRVAVSGVVRDWSGARRTGVNAAYVDAVTGAGAIPLILSPRIGADRAGDALAAADALVLSGGEDIAPARYGAAPSPLIGTVSPERDAFELALFEAARRLRLPTLAICRGIQLVNVALGGTLWRDLPSERGSSIDHDPPAARTARTHAVRLAAGSRTALAVGAERVAVNSFHHQAVKELAPGLVATGWADDGVVEALESADGTQWLVGVQWHPEELQEEGAPDRGLFAALVTEAISARRGRARSGRPRRTPERTPGR